MIADPSPSAAVALVAATACPACTRAAFRATDEVIDIDRVMQRWTDHGVRFNAETIDRYSSKKLGPIQLYQCDACQFGQYLPIVVGDSDFYSAVGNLEYYTEAKWEFTRSLEVIAKKRPRTLIDLGCGSGLFLDQLRAAMPAINAKGLEINELAASQARSRGHHVDVLDWGSESFRIDNLPKADLIVCHQVLEHVGNPIRFLRAVRAMLSVDGVAIISTPNSAGLVGMQADALTEQPPHHVTKWTNLALRNALLQVGFKSFEVNFEPLPKILWPGYLPKIWQTNGWLATMGRAAAHLGRLHGEGMNWVSDVFEKNDVPYIYGAGGHTILMVAHSSDVEAGRATSGAISGPVWLRRLRKRFAEWRRARRIASQRIALDQATAALKASVEQFAQQIDTAMMELEDQRRNVAENDDQPSRLTTAALDVLASVVLATNRHFKRKTFLEESGHPCESNENGQT